MVSLVAYAKDLPTDMFGALTAEVNNNPGEVIGLDRSGWGMAGAA